MTIADITFFIILLFWLFVIAFVAILIITRKKSDNDRELKGREHDRELDVEKKRKKNTGNND
ncbi:hypothetical protein QA612_13750 [Evansella sp. AB-P1]|uniref:hypothetical protein n=1 Tax=Evansella sp. AB-P1 TaxID=3037653 RepID=UPI00241E5BE9|nr:hypothetical protein [Evansella sp. AB-P1]MDG5788546.1 hypothetical protein [Evansella sp. AB-P1]